VAETLGVVAVMLVVALGLWSARGRAAPREGAAETTDGAGARASAQPDEEPQAGGDG
jgi:hypothetical protein